MRRTIATICTGFALAASMAGGPAHAAQPTKVSQPSHTTPAAGAVVDGSQPGWPPGTLTDGYLSTDTRHYSAKRTGEVREVVRFELAEPSRVYVSVRDANGKYIRGPVQLGVRPAGWNYWTWTGHANGGAKAPDGAYVINIFTHAVSDGHYYPTGTSAFVHRYYHPGSVRASHSTLFPRSTTLHDSTSLGVRPLLPAKFTMRVRDPAGHVVFTRSSEVLHSYQRVKWDGRTRSGKPLPAGTYYVTAAGVDADGFSGTTKRRAMVVSAKKLVNRTRTFTVPASYVQQVDSGTYHDGCNGCIEWPDCGTVTPSDRFTTPGALSYRSGPGCGSRQGVWRASGSGRYIPHDNAPRGYGTVTMSVFGGPSTPGAADQGQLNLESSTVMTGSDVNDHTTTTGTVPVGTVLNYDAGDYDDVAPGFAWSFTTRDGASYDLATLTFTYTYLTPQD